MIGDGDPVNKVCTAQGYQGCAAGTRGLRARKEWDCGDLSDEAAGTSLHARGGDWHSHKRSHQVQPSTLQPNSYT
jgi:hypothetical protein